jgi:tetratricopeptide (TPR) repeat protein
MHVLLLALFASGFAPNTAWAEPGDQAEKDERARELFQNGRALYDEGQYEAAIEAWTVAYELSPKPLLLFNLTSAHERLGHLEIALETLNKYRVYAAADERNTLESRIRNLEKRIKDAAENAPPPTDPDPIPDPVPEPEPSDGGDVLGLAVIGIGGAGLITGTIFALSASNARSQLGDECAETDALTLCRPAADDLMRKDKSSSLGADVGFIVGAVGVGLGTVLVLGGDKSSADVWAEPLPGGARAGVSGRF